MIESTVRNSLIQFNSSQYITAAVAPLQLFQRQTQSYIEHFTSSARNDFSSSLTIIRKTTQGNALLSAQLTNYYLTSAYTNYYVSAVPTNYSGCNCRLLSTCVSQLSFVTNAETFNVPGFYVGCYVIEALLQSTLECFYHQTCVDELQLYLSPNSSLKVTALNSSLPSQYAENASIEHLLQNLMVEQWKWSPVYNRYYDECQPIQCTYSIETRNDAIYIVTTMFGIVGGLITVLKFVVPQVVKFVRKKMRRSSQSTVGKGNLKMFCDVSHMKY